MICLKDIHNAQKRIKPAIYQTPVRHSHSMSKIIDANVNLKCENLQKTGSFKLRGAMNKISIINNKQKEAKIVTSSAGNHAQGVAYASSQCGYEATIVMPKFAPLSKINATKGYGGNVILQGDCFDEANKYAYQLCKDKDTYFIPPYDDEDIICGQGTIGLEILEQHPDVNTIIVPAGGGGLLAGIAVAVKMTNPKIKVYGVQAKKANAIEQSFKSKSYVCTDNASTIADGIAVKAPGKITTKIINKYVDNIFTVDDNQIAQSVLYLMERNKIIVEPAGATSAAALWKYKDKFIGKNIVCVISGGNIDVNSINNIVERGLFARERKLELSLIVDAGPYGVKNTLATIMDLGAQINHVSVDKNYHYCNVDEIVLFVRCETNGHEHCEAIQKKLLELGITILD